MAAFIGNSEHKVDRKGRVSVPAAFRQELIGQTFNGIMAYPSRRGTAIEACGIDEMNQKINELGFDVLDEGTAKKPSPVFYKLQKLPFDPEGRVMLPPSLRARAQIEDQACFVGIGKYFQIWSPHLLAAYCDEQEDGE